MTITPAAGQVVVNSVDPALTLSTRSDAVHLDSDGLMRAYLVCTDDPDIEPHNSWTYSFRGDWSGSPTVTCPVPMVPVDPETGKMPPLNLSTAVSRASVSGVLITKGAKGDQGPGIASIDPDGTVHLDDGSTVTWDLPPAVADDAAVAELVATETATKTAVESRIREVGDGTYAALGDVGLDESALAESISNPETASNAAVLSVASSLVPGGLISAVDAMTNLAAPRPAGAGSVMWLVPAGTAEPVNFREGDFYARATSTVVEWNPSQLPNTVGWWDAQSITAADGAALSQWNDLSGNVRHAVQATSGAQPIYRASGINTHPAVQFDGVDDILAAAVTGTALSGAAWTVYAVGQDTRATSTSSKFLFDGYTNAPAGQRLALSRSSTNTFVMQRGTPMSPTSPPADALSHRFRCVFNGASSSITIGNGTPVTGTVGSTPTEYFTRLTLGGRGDLANFLQGFLGEIIIVQGTVSPADDAKMTTYLQGRWGVA